MSKRKALSRAAGFMLLGAVFAFSGCLHVSAPDEINLSAGTSPRRVDNRRVPTTKNHEEARQKLAEAYGRNRYLERRVEELEDEVRELEEEKEEYKRKYKREKDKNDD